MFYWNYIGSNLGNPKNQAIYQSDQLVILAGSSISNHSDASKCKYPIELHPQAYADHDNCVIYLFKNDNHAFVDDLPISGVYDQVGVYCQFMAFLTGKLNKHDATQMDLGVITQCLDKPIPVSENPSPASDVPVFLNNL